MSINISWIFGVGYAEQPSDAYVLAKAQDLVSVNRGYCIKDRGNSRNLY